MIAGVVFAAFSGVMKGVEQGRRNLDAHRLGRTALLRMAQEVRAAMHDAAYVGFSRTARTPARGITPATA